MARLLGSMHSPVRGLFLLALLLAWGCGGDTADTTAEGTSGEAGAGDAVETGEPVALVNGEPVLRADLDRVLNNLKNQTIQPDETVEGDTPEERLRNTALKVLIEQELIVQAAAAEGVVVEEGQVQMQLNNLKLRSGGEEEFQQALAAAGATEEDLTRDLRDNMIIREYFAQRVNQAPEITDTELHAFYDDNPNLYGPRPEVQARHILLRTSPNLDEYEKAGVLGRAREIRAELEGGADFAALAAEHSEDEGTAPNGGELGWFGPGRMVPPFDSTAFALEPGQIGGPVETQFGIHIIEVTDRRSSPARPFEEVRDQLYQGVLQKKQTAANQALLDELRAKAEIEILES